MKKPENKIDELFRQKLSGQSTPSGSEGWSEMERMLDEQKGNRRRGLWLFVAFLALSIVGIATWKYTSGLSAAHPDEAVNQKSIMVERTSSDITEKNHTIGTEQTSDVGIEPGGELPNVEENAVQGFESNGDELKRKEVEGSGKEHSTTSVSNNKTSSEPIKKKTGNTRTSDLEKKNLSSHDIETNKGISTASAASMESVGDSGTDVEKVVKVEPLTKMGTTDIDNSGRKDATGDSKTGFADQQKKADATELAEGSMSGLPIDPLPAPSVAGSPISQPGPSGFSPPMLNSILKESPSSNKRRPRIEASVYTAYTISSFGDQYPLLARRDEEEKATLTTGFDVNFFHGFGDLRLGLGLQYLNSGENVQYSPVRNVTTTEVVGTWQVVDYSYFQIDSTWDQGFLIIDTTFVIDFDSTYFEHIDTIVTTTNDESIAAHNGRSSITMVSLPIRFGWQFDFEKSFIYLSGSVQPTWIVKRQASYLGLNGDQLIDASTENSYRKMAWAASLGVAWNREILKGKAYYTVNPMVRMTLNSWNSEYTHRYLELGMRFGIGYFIF